VSRPALLIIDVQKAIDDPRWGSDRNNPQAESTIARLLEHWRRCRWLVVHVRHASTEPNSTYRPDAPGFAFKEDVQPLAGERILEKSTNSAFIGTGLEQQLRGAGIESVVVTGVITNNSVEATARMAGNLGFATYVVSDATATFGRYDYDGRWRTSAEVHAMSLANLNGEYATVICAAELLARLPCC
jgi:nicotinamidase-related amidase